MLMKIESSTEKNQSYVPISMTQGQDFMKKFYRGVGYIFLIITCIYIIASTSFKKPFDPTNGFLETPDTTDISYTSFGPNTACRVMVDGTLQASDYITLGPNTGAVDPESCQKLCTNWEQFDCKGIEFLAPRRCELYKKTPTFISSNLNDIQCYLKIDLRATQFPTRAPTEAPKFKQLGFQCITDDSPNVVSNVDNLYDCQNTCLGITNCQTFNFQTRDYPFTCSIYFDNKVENAEQNYINSVCYNRL